jgi:hypothetical protein
MTQQRGAANEHELATASTQRIQPRARRVHITIFEKTEVDISFTFSNIYILFAVRTFNKYFHFLDVSDNVPLFRSSYRA